MDETKKNTNAKILIIDDDVNLMDMLSIILSKYGHTVYPFTEPVSAIEAMKSEKYDILLVNYLMSPVQGDRIVKLVREFDKEIYIILMSMHKDLTPSIEIMQNLDIQSYFEKNSHFEQLVLLIQSGIKYIEQLNRIKSMGLRLEQYVIDFAKVLLNTVGAKDHYTEGHSIRVSKYAKLFGESLNLPEEDVELLKNAGYFHDIGKIGIPDSILLKTTVLTNEEYEVIKSHPVTGANILSVSQMFNDIIPIILYHHERIDGKGYPEKLNGNEIPYLAKILALCDCFDAITAKRPYKEKSSIEYALNEINRNRGTQFDTNLTDNFIKTINDNIDIVQEIINIT